MTHQDKQRLEASDPRNEHMSRREGNILFGGMFIWFPLLVLADAMSTGPEAARQHTVALGLTLLAVVAAIISFSLAWGSLTWKAITKSKSGKS